MLAERNGEHVGDRAFLDHEGAVHIGFAEFQFRIEQDAPFGGAGGKADRHRLAGAVAKGEDRAARGGDPKRPPADEGLEQKLKQPVHRPPPQMTDSLAPASTLFGPRYLIKLSAAGQCYDARHRSDLDQGHNPAIMR